MHIDIVPNRASTPTILLRESYREGDKVKKRTLANLSSLSMDKVELIRMVLRGDSLAPVAEIFENVSSVHHGHVQAVHGAMKRLGMDKLIGTKPSRERDLVLAMVAARVVEPDSKLATTRWWKNTSLPEVFGVTGAGEEDLYAAMDWLVDRQDVIEKKLATRHLCEGGLVLYDLSSSYVEGTHCPLAFRGYNRDGKKGKLQVNYGLLTNPEGIPVAISAFPGNTSDSKTVMTQLDKLRGDFGIGEMVLVGDRGMISQNHIESFQKEEGIDWITALKSGSIRKLINDDSLQLGLFDEKNLFEFTHPDYPGERLIACKNHDLAKHRRHNRQSLLDATLVELNKIKKSVDAGRLTDKDKIGVRVGKIINKYKMSKHIELTITDTALAWEIKQDNVREEQSLDGIYIIRTSICSDKMSSADAVRSYKSLSNVERAFRSMKSIDLEVRPIYHRLENRVRAHLFLCMLSYYVKWHMMEAWRPLIFADEDKEAKKTRDPVAPAQRSDHAQQKAASKQLEDGTKVQSFQSLLKSLSTIVQNECRYKKPGDRSPTFMMDTMPSKEQQRAFDLLATITM
jgi:transposase